VTLTNHYRKSERQATRILNLYDRPFKVVKTNC